MITVELGILVVIFILEGVKRVLNGKGYEMVPKIIMVSQIMLSILGIVVVLSVYGEIVK
ncbi:hypothetical protein [Bacteroides acidifaciens]|uniref:hypothetical protein n=1 Tax=Bacteroides acidifaciens TaxID=85831 RepID=UPI0026E9B20C|nr:hypothetical protein [Bacteroides acidifaciens]